MFQPLPRATMAVTSLVLNIAMGAPQCQAASPAPGLYQVEQTFTMRGAAYGPTYVEWVHKTDGQTGVMTVTRRAMPAGTTSTEQRPGNGPVRACVRAAQPPLWLNARNCGPNNVVQAPNGPEFTAKCLSAQATHEQWQPLGDTAWEHRYLVPMAPSGGGAVPPAATAALAPAMAAMEETARHGPPDHAAMARQQLAALRSADAGGGRVSGSVVERWTRVADHCDGVR